MTYEQAFSILGILPNANEAQIKTAYRRLAKKYHPDSGIGGNAHAYDLVHSAYDFLMKNPLPKVVQKPRKVVGNLTNNSYSYQNRREREKLEKTFEKQQTEKKEQFARKVEAFKQKEEEKKKESEYAERAAEILRMMLYDGVKQNIPENDTGGER